MGILMFVNDLIITATLFNLTVLLSDMWVHKFLLLYRPTHIL